MGLRDKIKGAMHSDKDNTDHADGYGNQYDSNTAGTTHGTQNYQTGTHADSKYTDNKYDNTATDTTAGYGHKKTDSGVGLHNSTTTRDDGINRTSNTQEPYWGNVANGRNSPPRTTGGLNSADNHLHRKDLPLRPGEQPTNSTLDSQRYDTRGSATGGNYNTAPGSGARDYDSRLPQGRDVQPQDAGDFSRETGHSLNAVGYQNQPGSTLRMNQPTDNYDSRIRDRDMGRDGRSGIGAAAAGVGAAGAGVAGANLANRDRNPRRDDFDTRDPGYNANQYQAGGGVPQSSMLDPSQTGPGYNNRVGPHDSDLVNKMDPRVDSDLDGRRRVGAGQAGLGNNASSTVNQAASSGMGPGHFGPGHTGAKVVHTCVACGQDNDISQYFSKDATYRMG